MKNNISIICLMLISIIGLDAQVFMNKRDITCHGAGNGKATVTSIENAVRPIKNYQWSNGKSGPTLKTITGLDRGSYTVTVTDANGCKAKNTVEISEPSKLKLTVTSSSGEFFVCGGACINIHSSVSGGTPPYSSGYGPGITRIRQVCGEASGAPECLRFLVTDSKGCKVKKTQCFAFSSISCASDPNDITGPIGVEEPRWISDQGSHEYLIRFENDPIFATAPAQEVKVTVPVDPNVNPFSIRLGEFGWGPYLFDIPANSTFFQTRIDLRDSLDLFVDMTAGLDVTKNEFFWFLQSIDPNTGQRPIDPQKGFLPVNDSLTSVGEGFINYMVSTQSDVVTGDTILAQASIVFDVNEAIETNIWNNRIDAFGPITMMASFLDDTTANTEIELSWLGDDDDGGVGIDYFEIYVAIDTGEYELLLGNYDSTEFTFVAEPGFQYKFFSIGVDGVGNKESLKMVDEASIFVLQEKELELLSPIAANQCVQDSLTIKWSVDRIDTLDVLISFNGGVEFSSLGVYASIQDSVTLFIDESMISDQVLVRIIDHTDTTKFSESPIFAINELPVVTISNVVEICQGDPVFLEVTGANQYVWNEHPSIFHPETFNPVASPDSTQMFYVTGTDVFGCRNTDSVEVVVNPVFTKYKYTPICAGDSVLVAGQWETQPGDYPESYTTEEGCDSTIIFVVSYLSDNWLGNTTVFVDSSATGDNDGSSWENAFTNLQNAFCLTYSIDSVNEIWTAKGTYFPSEDSIRMMSFVLQDSVKVFGGFAGGEAIRTQRDPVLNLTILSGDLGVKNSEADNAMHVVRVDPASTNSILDGFTISDANANGVSFIDQRGAGVLSEGVATLSNIYFKMALSTVEASYILNLGATAKLTLQNCQFESINNMQINPILNANDAELILEENVNIQKE